MKELPKEAIEACRPRLIAELAQNNTDVAVLMGNSAIKAVMPKEESKKGVTKLRSGPPKQVNIGRSEPHPLPVELGGIHLPLKVIPTFHPAACLRNQSTFPLMLGDVAKALVPDQPRMWYEPNIITIENPHADPAVTRNALDIIESLLELNKDYGVVVDTESGRDKDTSFGRDDGPYGRILCIGIGGLHQDVEHDVYVFSDSVLASLDVRKALTNLFNECGIIAQNGKYDVGVLMSFLEQEEPFPLSFDTMLASYCLYEVGGIHGLKYMGQEVLGTPDWDSVIKPFITKDQGYATIPRDMLYRYNAFDVHVTRLLHGYFQNLIEEHGLTQLNQFLLRASRMLTSVERRGMGFDEDRARELEADYTAEIDQLEEQLPFNPRSPKQVKEWFLEHGVETESTDEDHLREILDRKGKRKAPEVVRSTIATVLSARRASKLRGTYVTGPLAKRTARGRVHTSYLLHGTTTGRLSSRGPNLQNIPRKGPVKTQYIPAQGNVLLSTDFSQAELRVITWLAKETAFQELFNDPTKDIFVELCRQLIPSYDSLTDEQKNEGRTLIKTFAYGIAYGRTAAGIAADPDFKMTVSEAKKQKDLFDARIPNIKAFQQDVIDRVHRGEDLITPFGRHRRFYLLTDSNRSSVENEAMAFLPQSTASDICVEAACRLTDDGLYIVNVVHDDIIAECKPDEVPELVALMNKTMTGVAEEVTEGYVSFATESKIGYSWGDMKKMK